MLRRPSDTENKLLLLHAIDRLGAVTAEQLLVFMTENEQMGYVSLQLGLAELDDAGLIRRQKHPLGTLYVITDEGRASWELFEKRVPHSRRQSVDEKAAEWRQRFRREKQMLSEFERRDDGEYTIRLRLLEHNVDLLRLELSVPTHEHAQFFCDAWQTQADGIYAHIMRALSEGDTKTQ